MPPEETPSVTKLDSVQEGEVVSLRIFVFRMAYNHHDDSCPSCSTPLTLFTPRERMQHINECLDAGDEESRGPTCAVCHRSLNFLTPAARQEHVNRCLDVRLPRRRQPQPVRKRPRSTSATSTRIPLQARQHKQCDEKVAKLLTLLGLERYAQRFGDEEIDLDTLRILKDEDFVSLRIPDAARRRIADALHAVPILERLQDPPTVEPPDEPHIVPTQKFSTSNLGAVLRRRSPLLDNDDDDEYRPTQTAFGNDEQLRTRGRHSVSPENVSQRTREPESFPVTINLVTPTKQDVLDPGVIQTASCQSSESEFDFEKDILEQSQISLETKVEEWRNRKIRKEAERHQAEIDKIEAKYGSMIERLVGRSQSKSQSQSQSPESPLDHENVPLMYRNTSENPMDSVTIDLTTELSDESKEPTKSDSTKEKDMDEKGRTASVKTRNAMKDNEVEVLDCCSDSDKESLHEHVFKPVLPDLDYGIESDGLDDLSQIAKLGSIKLFLPDNEDAEAAKAQDESDDDLLDLVNEDSPGKGAAAELAGSVRQGVLQRRAGANSSSSEELPQTQRSRLKKRRTVTHNEISAAIKKDKSLHDRILKVESVSYEVILQSIRSSGTAVSRKALTNYLHSEGIMYKGETVSKTSKAYLNGLNSEF